MVDVANQTLRFKGKTLPITAFVVWFMTPFGLIDNLDEAVDKCNENDVPPQAVIVPVPVAIDEEGRYEMVVRT